MEKYSNFSSYTLRFCFHRALGETGKDEGAPSSSLSTDTANVTSIAHISVPKVTNVGTVTPDSDFMAILEHSTDASQIDQGMREINWRILEYKK